jgi:RNA-directed DNA polymerase
MHDPEKSDSAVVAVKPPNKAGSPAAEAVEPRAGTKGNVPDVLARAANPAANPPQGPPKAGPRP